MKEILTNYIRSTPGKKAKIIARSLGLDKSGVNRFLHDSSEFEQ